MTLSTSAVAVCCWRGFTKFAKQPRVLDGYDGLGSKILNQFDLLVGKGSHLLAVENDGALDFIFLEHRHA